MAASPTIRRGNGPGHGGPAKGAGSGPAVPFTADSPTRSATAHLENDDPEEQAYRAARRAEKRGRRRLKEERTVELEDRLYEVGMGLVSDATAVQIQAARSVHAMWNGMPVSNVNMKADVRRSVHDLTDEELIAFAGDGEGQGGTDEEDGGEE